MTISISKVIIQEISFLEFKLPDSLFNIIQDEVLELERANFKDAIPYNHLLAGALQHEYNLIKCESAIENFLRNFFQQDRLKRTDGKQLYLNRSKVNTQFKEYDTPAIWVNFQKKNEFNPIHNHSGDYSFVTWLRVPYEIENERKLAMMKSGNTDNSSCFMFVYSDTVPNKFTPGNIGLHRIHVDKSYIGRCIIFPSHLNHCVTPFYTSDDYRISVSGNFYFK